MTRITNRWFDFPVSGQDAASGDDFRADQGAIRSVIFLEFRMFDFLAHGRKMLPSGREVKKPWER